MSKWIIEIDAKSEEEALKYAKNAVDAFELSVNCSLPLKAAEEELDGKVKLKIKKIK